MTQEQQIRLDQGHYRLADLNNNTQALLANLCFVMSEACTSYQGVDFSTGLISTYNSPNATYPLRRVRPL